MEQERNSKNRIFYLGKLLYERTDEEHPLSTNELIELMESEYVLHVHRTTISSDIKQLISVGLDICTIETTQNKYFVASRLFDDAELKLLIDAVESSKFITKKKSKLLTAKLGRFTSINNADMLKRNLCIEERIKPGNEGAFYIADAINTAINKHRKISFQYFYYDENKQKKLKHHGEPYIFSPYTLVWNGDYYYVVGYSDKHQSIGNFRVDRIFTQPVILEEKAVPKPKNFRIAEYINSMFRMYNSKREEVKLICDNSVMDAIVDRFGEKVLVSKYDDKSFIATVNVAVNHVFFSWIFGFAGRVIIAEPTEVKEQFREMLNNVSTKIAD